MSWIQGLVGLVGSVVSFIAIKKVESDTATRIEQVERQTAAAEARASELSNERNELINSRANAALVAQIEASLKETQKLREDLLALQKRFNEQVRFCS